MFVVDVHVLATLAGRHLSSSRVKGEIWASRRHRVVPPLVGAVVSLSPSLFYSSLVSFLLPSPVSHQQQQ